MDYVRYIERTRAYYAALGYDKPYEWPHFEEAPFTPLAKPARDCRIALVSTSDVQLKDDEAAEGEFNAFTGNVYSTPSDTPAERLYSRQEHFDRHAMQLDDVDTFFPLSRFRELAAAGRIGGLAARAHGVITGYSKRKTLETDGPEVLRRLGEDGAEAVVLTPI